MSRFCKMILAAALLVILIPAMALHTAAASSEDTKPYIRKLISYYLHYQEQADEEIDVLLEYISSIDPKQGETWQKIMDNWSWTNTEMEINLNNLPDGLPQDDSMCIVVLGYGLNSNGSIKPELLDRLEVALRSAEKYPNALIAVTGGQTSAVSGVTEAGEMAAWLRDKGIDDSRIIVEDRSLSTTQNAQYTYQILTEKYPQVKYIAIVTSDYHIRWGCAMFHTVSLYASGYTGAPNLEIVGNAACVTSKASDTLYSQAWGIAIIAGVEFDGTSVPALYQPEKTVTPETESAAVTEPASENKGQKQTVAPVLVLILAAVVLWIVLPKKRRRRRKKT